MITYCVNDDCEVIEIEKGKVFRQIKSYDKNVMTVEVLFKNEAIGNVHKHTHEQISYCLEGEFDYYIEDKVYKLKTGDTIYVAPDLAHGCKLLSETGRLLDIFTPYREDFVNE